MTELKWTFIDWTGLTTSTLYDLLQLRAEVFVVEQNCPYQDVDDKDKSSWHLLGYDPQGNLMAYARVVLPGVSYSELSIGRVVIHSSVRGKGVGKTLMHKALQGIENQFGKCPIRISAQEYLIQFYQELGFEIQGNTYLEDNIPHIEMFKP